MSAPVYEALELVKRSVVGVHAGTGQGSGWVALDNGLIVTNLHVVGYLSRVQVQYFGHEAQIVDTVVVHADTKRDIAFLMPLEDQTVPPLQVADSRSAVVGLPVFGVGHPLGLGFSTTQGVVSAVDRTWRGVPYLQTDAAINPGNSGGPLVDSSGAVLGVSTFGFHGAENLNHALPVHLLLDDLEDHEQPAQLVRTKRPTYKCTHCDTVVSAGDYRCPACGTWLTPSGRRAAGLGAHILARNQRVVAQMLERLGFTEPELRVDDGHWRLVQPTGEVWIASGPNGSDLEFSSRIVKVPKSECEPFYRFLLSVNDRTCGRCKLGIERDIVTFSFVEPIAFTNVDKVAQELGHLLAMSEELRQALQQTYGAEPAPSKTDEMMDLQNIHAQ